MKELRFLDELVQRYPVLEPVKGDILKAYEIMRDCYEKGGKLMIAGNGGSCSDSEHIVGELMKTPSCISRTSPGFKGSRPSDGGKTGRKSPGRTSGHCTHRPWGIDYRFFQ